uniref:Uncharacterized protein n=1 Tax=Planktothricoides sp. SpSt-374 TaxID=2282167 RepID=A0A7C4A0B7_9CYAN
MARQLKRWESPRRQGRNSKGAGGSARARQLKKQRSMLVKKLKGEDPNQSQEKGNTNPFSFFWRDAPLENHLNQPQFRYQSRYPHRRLN